MNIKRIFSLMLLLSFESYREFTTICAHKSQPHSKPQSQEINSGPPCGRQWQNCFSHNLLPRGECFGRKLKRAAVPGLRFRRWMGVAVVTNSILTTRPNTYPYKMVNIYIIVIILLPDINSMRPDLLLCYPNEATAIKQCKHQIIFA